MIKFKLTCTARNHEIGVYDTRHEATDVMDNYISEFNNDNDLDPDDEEWLCPFDFTLKEVEVVQDIAEVVVDYNTAREYLGGKPNKQFTVGKKIAAANTVPGLEEVTRLVDALNPSHVQALIALNELFTIAQAWNKADNFTPDFSNRNQDKWFPWFVYDSDRAGFVCAYTYYAPSYTNAAVGSRLCFKTPNRARQFGEQFIDLWNRVLLIK